MTTNDGGSAPGANGAAEPELYLNQLLWRYPQETANLARIELEAAVREGLKLCAPLKIDEPKEILRFLALIVLLTPAQKRSALLGTVVYRVLMGTPEWSARKRLEFIHRFVVGRPPPEVEPDFGVWFLVDPQVGPALTPADLARSVLNPIAVRPN